jgi:hypothetical protein
VRLGPGRRGRPGAAVEEVRSSGGAPAGPQGPAGFLYTCIVCRAMKAVQACLKAVPQENTVRMYVCVHTCSDYVYTVYIRCIDMCIQFTWVPHILYVRGYSPGFLTCIVPVFFAFYSPGRWDNSYAGLQTATSGFELVNAMTNIVPV